MSAGDNLNPGQFASMSHEEFASQPGTYWHGTPSGEIGSGNSHYGLHVGSQEAARQALNARIGRPADGRDWSGDREYGKTLLGGYHAGYHSDAPKDAHYPTGRASYSTGDPVPMTARPALIPLRITGPMTNTPQRPHEDSHANGLMAGQLKRGTAKRGYFYTNIGEDEGSVSAVLPGRGHVATHKDYVRAALEQNKPVRSENLSRYKELRRGAGEGFSIQGGGLG